MNPLFILDVVRFELRRSMSPGRMAIWIMLVLFPIALITAIRMLSDQGAENTESWGLVLYLLVPEVVCLLGLLLWATPSVSTEIEGQTWIYLAMRRSGRNLVLVGKYLTAVIWSFSAAFVAATACTIIMGSAGGLKLWFVVCVLSLLSCLAHGALYVLIGTVFFRRTMVTAVFYTLAIEYGLSLVPAMANRLTVNYRLRGLLAEWMDWYDARTITENIGGQEPAWFHVLILLVISITLIFVAIQRLTWTEIPTQQEG